MSKKRNSEKVVDAAWGIVNRSHDGDVICKKLEPKTIECWGMYKESMDTMSCNSGYRKLGEGVGESSLHIKQGLQGMILNEADIMELLKALRMFDPRLR